MKDIRVMSYEMRGGDLGTSVKTDWHDSKTRYVVHWIDFKNPSYPEKYFLTKEDAVNFYNKILPSVISIFIAVDFKKGRNFERIILDNVEKRGDDWFSPRLLSDKEQREYIKKWNEKTRRNKNED